MIDPNSKPWRPGGHPFLAHMFLLMKQARHRQKRRIRLESEVLDGGVAQESTANDDPRIDDEVDRMRSLAVLRKLGERVLERLGSDDPLPRQLYEMAMEKDLDPQEEAALFGRTHKEIQGRAREAQVLRPHRPR